MNRPNWKGMLILALPFIIVGLLVFTNKPEEPTQQNVIVEDSQESRIAERQRAEEEKKKAEQQKKIEEEKKKAEAELAKAKELETFTGRMWVALDTSKVGRQSTHLEVDEKAGTVVMQFKPESYWSNELLVQGHYRSIVNYGKEAFKDQGLKKLTLETYATATDDFGKESMTLALKTSFNRDSFLKYEWDNLKGKPIVDSIRLGAETLYVHNFLMNEVNLAQIKL